MNLKQMLLNSSFEGLEIFWYFASYGSDPLKVPQQLFFVVVLKK